jgi:Flp pilus assembly protein TadG
MNRLSSLGWQDEGATIVEFALVAPVLLMTIMGTMDMGHTMYTDTLLEGGIQKSARDSSIEGATAAELDARVAVIVKRISPKATLTFNRKSYTNFSDVRQPEDYTDLNGDSACDNNEPFEDANGNGIWDADRGTAGGGGARDAVLYTVTVTYPRLFPMAAMIGLRDTVSMQAATVLRNQPYAQQAQEAPVVGNCT